MKIAVIDDEKPQADILYSICNAYFGGHKQNVQIDCFPDGIAFFNSFKENTYKIALGRLAQILTKAVRANKI